MSQQVFAKEQILKEVEKYEHEIELRRQGKLEEKVFAEIRLRKGVYGQRYDNGQRHDGIQPRSLDYPSADLMKGPNTRWDAPGMQRIKVPFGGLTPEQLEVVAELAEEFSDGIAHVTTRQDFQLHFVHIDDTPEIMRRLAEVGITTQEACGNVVRNVTACPIVGVCHDEAFDVTPYARALTQFLLGHPDAQDFGRKFKIAFSGCAGHACGLTSMHDLGAIARKRTIDGVEKRGFELYVGGGLGAVPHKAKLFDEFVPEEELLPLAQAIARVFARHGEKKNRTRARIKFLVQKLGIEAFRQLVKDERAQLAHDPRWTDFIPAAHNYREEPLKTRSKRNGRAPEAMADWLKTNVYQQKQSGYATVTINLPLGDITPTQLRRLADIARRFTAGTVRTTVEQNIVLRWISENDLPELYLALQAAHLAHAGASMIEDITACPGTDTCKLGIASSRGLAAVLLSQLAEGKLLPDSGNGINSEAADIIRKLHIKISGCFNSCGQHHIADLGFYGVNRKVGSHTVPHFQVVLGGQWSENAAAYGLAIGAVPSKNIPKVVERIASHFARQRQPGETFQTFIRRI
ncbi:nitrite/sulfite reductase, partial [bacterium]|nr:nitrite/sulfite reductase [bacterium]